MRLLIIDFETQGDDPMTTNPTEVGAMVVDATGCVDTNPPVEYFKSGVKLSQLIYTPEYPPQTEEIVDITGITDEMLKKDGLHPTLVFGTQISPLVADCDYVVAHNAKFDRGVYEATCARLGLEVKQPREGWICTLNDVPYPKKYRCKKLSHLAYDHGFVVDPSTLHRAINDVELLAGFLTKHYRMDAILEYRATPWAYVFLNGVKKPWLDGGVTNAQAKKLGYSWQKVYGTDGPEFVGRWVKRLKDIPELLAAEKARTPEPFTLSKTTAT